MPRYKKKKATFESFESLTPNDRYFRITNSMFTSKAWDNMSIYAHEVYMRMKHKYTKNDFKGISNKDNITLTYPEINGIMNTRTFTKAIDELIEHGFIVINFYGRFSRSPNIYGFSDMWQFYGTDSFEITKRISKKSILPSVKIH